MLSADLNVCVGDLTFSSTYVFFLVPWVGLLSPVEAPPLLVNAFFLFTSADIFNFYLEDNSYLREEAYGVRRAKHACMRAVLC